jgi:single-strand DNA-binding protein
MSFSVANNTGFGDKQQTHYFECSLFGDRADGKLKDYMLKGAQVIVEGEISLNTYQKQDGTQAASLRVFVQNVELVGGQRNDSQAQPAPSQSTQQRPSQAASQGNAPAPSYDDFDDDLPF